MCKLVVGRLGLVENMNVIDRGEKINPKCAFIK